MKGEKRLKVLEFIKNSVTAADELFFIFTVPYGTSFHKAEYLLRKYREEKERREFSSRERQRFADLLYRLRKDGLVEDAKRNGKILLNLTQKGKEILEKLRAKKDIALPDVKYKNQTDNVLKIVIFDIPESERRKRVWLCSALRDLEFTMLQKSVWIGKVRLPEEFMDDLKKLELISYVEIFAISKTGSLKQLK